MNLEQIYGRLLHNGLGCSWEEVERYFRDFYPRSLTFCAFCCGYYGQNHGQPLCSTCHIFTTNLHSSPLWLPAKTGDSNGYKNDSEDSGNEDSGPDPGDSVSVNSSTGAAAEEEAAALQPEDQRLSDHLHALSTYNPNDEGVGPGWVESRLPPEVLKRIMLMLDDLSLWCCWRVCKRWADLIRSETTAAQWAAHVRTRWPLFRPLAPPVCWFKTYDKLVATAPCLKCLHRFFLDRPGTLESFAEKYCCRRLASELRMLQTDPPEGVEAAPLNHCGSKWVAGITGPRGSPYEGGKFFLSIDIPPSYPLRPPVLRFLTKILHPNVSPHGDIGLDILTGQSWIPALTISKLLLSIQSFLTDPITEVCMDARVGVLCAEKPRVFRALAQMWTWKYAMVDVNMPFQ